MMLDINKRVERFNDMCLNSCNMTMSELGFYVKGDSIVWERPEEW